MSDTRVITPEAILSYPALISPKKHEQSGQLRYQAELVFTDGTDLSSLTDAAEAAIAEEFGNKVPGDLKTPFDTRWEKFGYPEGSVFVRCNTTEPPGLVKGPRREECRDADEFYPGAIVIAELSASAYNVSGSKGVKFYLNSVWKIRDGERLAPKRSAGDAFKDVQVDAAAFGEEPSRGESQKTSRSMLL